MSFLFKSKKQSTNGLPSASRNITSADGSSNVSTSAGFVAGKDGDKRRTAPIQTASPNGGAGTTLAVGGGAAAGQGPVMRGVYSPSFGERNPRDRNEIGSAPQPPRNSSMTPTRPIQDLSLYPWSQRSMSFVANPFPRYGAGVNSVASKEGDIYQMGGLINGITVKGDLYIIEAASPNLNCYPVPTTSEGPGPRVGHASLLVGNAFIVFGGDTKLEEADPLDNTLYLLNTSTKHWSRASPAGPRPAGRYGHTLNLLGSKIYVFGGQIESYFFNDLVAFDLNGLTNDKSRWEMLIRNSDDGGPPQGQSPAPRTNHTVITYNERLYLFGGTDGVRWFNDVWTYDPRTNMWTPQECIGFIPAARENHAAALVGDVMYVQGGRSAEGKDLGDLAAFRITTKRWYTFQNMGPSPSPRSGHSMTTFHNELYVLGGEPSSSPYRDNDELSLVYILDTTKIRYPPEGQQHSPGQRQGGGRRPSAERSGTPQERSTSREGSRDRGARDPGANGMRKASLDSLGSQQSVSQRQEIGMGNGYPSNTAPAKSLRSGIPPALSGPPPKQQAPQIRTNGINGFHPTATGSDLVDTSRSDPVMEQTITHEPQYGREPHANIPQNISTPESVNPASVVRGQYTLPQISLPRDVPNQVVQHNLHDAPFQATNQSMFRADLQSMKRPEEPSNHSISNTTSVDLGSPNRSREDAMQPTNSAPYQYGNAPNDFSSLRSQQPGDHGAVPSAALIQRHDELRKELVQREDDLKELNQRKDHLLKELEAATSKNTWYASELALARRSGFRSDSTEGAPVDERQAEAVGDNEKPMLEVLLRMKTELVRVQKSLEDQSELAAQRIAQVEKERDAAISEAVYAKTKSAARGWKHEVDDSRDTGTPDSLRSGENRLASALASQSELSVRILRLEAEVDSERRARQIAEESADAAHNRVSELDAHSQHDASELEQLRSELHEVQKKAREDSANASEALASAKLLQVDKNELNGKLSIAYDDAKNYSNILNTVREALTTSSEKTALLERQFEHEKRQRNTLEEKLAHLRGEHETRVSELELTTRRLQDAEELAESHAKEARSHREVVMAGLGKTTDRGVDEHVAQDERVSILQERLDAANALVRQNQEAADKSSERLRRAEERIAALESSQLQITNDGLSVRKQLQAASRETLALRSENADLQQQLASHKLDAASLQVQHSALKDLLGERGIDPTDPSRVRLLDNNSAANTERLLDLEQQLEASNKAHEEMRLSFEQREQEANRNWENKIAALDNDYQSAVKYLKGTEKMLSKMKQELHKYKTQNKDLEEELSHNAKSTKDLTADWEQERVSLRNQVNEMQSRIQQSASQLDKYSQDLRVAQNECIALRQSSTHYQQQLQTESEQSRANLEKLRVQNSHLEARAAEAERKVQLLLETVDNGVNNHHTAQQVLPNGAIAHQTGGESLRPGESGGHNRGLSFNSIGGDSIYSAGADSMYDGEDGVNEEVMSRNSVALDSLASELETLRTHWEATTNKSHRLSDRSDTERTTPAATVPAISNTAQPSTEESLTSWRRRLKLAEPEEEESRSRGPGDVAGSGREQ